MHGVNGEAPKCERCGRDVRRVFSPVGIIFKGSGWHITDYRKTPAPAEGEAKKTETASAEKSSADGGTSDGKAKTGAAEGGASEKSNGKSGRAATGGAGSKPASRSRGGTTS
jgi:predicted nucleic acid-binding Zn ribbon protein